MASLHAPVCGICPADLWLRGLGTHPGVAYGIKTGITGIVLLGIWPRVRHEFHWEWRWMAVGAGVLVVVIWVGLEGTYPQPGSSDFNPGGLGTGRDVCRLMAVRLMGAVIVLPLMEELFWRSFAQRVLISENYLCVPLGSVTPPFISIVSIAFGFEHHRWLPGILAGLIYAGVLARTRNLFIPTLSHSITNLAPGLCVIKTAQWTYW